MKKEYRIKKNKEIEEVIKNKEYYTNRYFIIYLKKNLKTTHFRYAISVGKKLGKAVTRNRIKRQIVAIIDNSNINFEENNDVFIIVKKNVLDIDFSTMGFELNYLFKKHKLLKEIPCE